MTTRERVSAILVLAGGVCLVAAAGLVSGLWAALAVAGVLFLVVGVLLGLEPTPAAPAAGVELVGDDFEQAS